ncbi:hypothetical protein LZ31DRAFT_155874 [Colletotrichum somersetense]|nr:hypothetical protein LZ31DRAFT_155874 [Colletotrichum somersetense]
MSSSSSTFLSLCKPTPRIGCAVLIARPNAAKRSYQTHSPPRGKQNRLSLTQHEAPPTPGSHPGRAVPGPHPSESLSRAPPGRLIGRRVISRPAFTNRLDPELFFIYLGFIQGSMWEGWRRPRTLPSYQRPPIRPPKVKR